MAGATLPPTRAHYGTPRSMRWGSRRKRQSRVAAGAAVDNARWRCERWVGFPSPPRPRVPITASPSQCDGEVGTEFARLRAAEGQTRGRQRTASTARDRRWRARSGRPAACPSLARTHYGTSKSMRWRGWQRSAAGQGWQSHL